mmetsp:Transcript_12246/g.51504  ORF Transcript_12246/g.51504 Transcript_12246/m.51504 type:complete len:268 (+) Transcript_12246:3586-4389(+)
MFPAITEIARPASAPTSSRAAGPRGLLSSPARASRDPCRRPAPPARVTRAPSVGVRTQHFLELLELVHNRPTALAGQKGVQAFCSLRHSRRRARRTRHARVAQVRVHRAPRAPRDAPMPRGGARDARLQDHEDQGAQGDPRRQGPGVSRLRGKGGLRRDGCGRLVPPDRRETRERGRDEGKTRGAGSQRRGSGTHQAHDGRDAERTAPDWGSGAGRHPSQTPLRRRQVLRRRGHAPGPAPEPGEGHGEHQDEQTGRRGRRTVRARAW